jgi:hypothetical protein
MLIESPRSLIVGDEIPTSGEARLSKGDPSNWSWLSEMELPMTHAGWSRPWTPSQCFAGVFVSPRTHWHCLYIVSPNMALQVDS